MIQILSVIIIHSTPFNEVAQGPTPPKEEFSLKGGKTIQVTQILFSGNEAISSTQLQRLVKQYENRMLSEFDIQEMQRRIELLYKSKGFDEVQVTIPQKQASGSLQVVIVEGKNAG